MVALVTRGVDNTPSGIHRIFLARDGSGKGPLDPTKMMLGPCRGGVVPLGEADEVLMVGEGIETCLAADMVVLAETFLGWAIEEPGIAPHHRQRWATGWRQWRPAR
jgi:hypothetical protein